MYEALTFRLTNTVDVSVYIYVYYLLKARPFSGIYTLGVFSLITMYFIGYVCVFSVFITYITFLYYNMEAFN